MLNLDNIKMNIFKSKGVSTIDLIEVRRVKLSVAAQEQAGLWLHWP